MPLASETLSSISKRRKVLIPLTVVLLILILLIFSINSSSARNLSKNKINEKLDLKLVHVFFRHGSRTPADTYKNDIYINETFSPYGWGQLTNKGKTEMYELGKFLNLRYHDFIGDDLNLNEIYAQSTGVDRTKMSLQLVLASLFPPKNTPLEWNRDLNWQPIPFKYEELDNDSLLLVRNDCPRYYEEYERILKEDVVEEIRYHQKMMNEVSNITGLKIQTPDDVQSLYSTLKAEQEFGLKLPKWTENYFPSQLENLTEKSYVYNSYNKILKRLKGGVFLKKTIEEWELKKSNKLKKKFFIYAGHDSTVANILSAFNVWKQQLPDYGICGILEFSQHKVSNEYGVEIFLLYKSKYLTPLKIHGCDDSFCELNKLKILIKDFIPDNWNLECRPLNDNFSVPTIGSP